MNKLFLTGCICILVYLSSCRNASDTQYIEDAYGNIYTVIASNNKIFTLIKVEKRQIDRSRIILIENLIKEK